MGYVSSSVWSACDEKRRICDVLLSRPMKLRSLVAARGKGREKGKEKGREREGKGRDKGKGKGKGEREGKEREGRVEVSREHKR
jgi:hypothetical protein